MHGGLRIRGRAAALRSLIDSSEHLYRRAMWSSWLQANPLLVLYNACTECQERGITQLQVENEITGDSPRPWTPAQAIRVRRQFQATVSTLLRRRAPFDPQERMRQRLNRWRLPGFPRRTAARALQSLESVRTVAPPRVCAAVLSTMWNRWTTARRFQGAGRCVFLCSPTAQDSIEHYCSCAVVRQAYLKGLRLRLRAHPEALSDFLLVSLPPGDGQQNTILTRTALMVYATYVVTNAIRHGGHKPAEALEMLRQAILNGAQGHRGAERMLGELWL